MKHFIALLFKVNWLRTLLLNVSNFGFMVGIKCPILIGHGVKIDIPRNQNLIQIEAKKKFGMISLGVSRGSFYLGSGKSSYIRISENSYIRFRGSCVITKGFTIVAQEGGSIEIGNAFSSNPNLLLLSVNNIRIGDDCIFGWNISIRDYDGHDIISTDISSLINPSRIVAVGNSVWLSSDVTMLKGSGIGDGSIAGAKTIITKDYSKYTNQILVGNPARVAKDNIYWKK